MFLFPQQQPHVFRIPYPLRQLLPLLTILFSTSMRCPFHLYTPGGDIHRSGPSRTMCTSHVPLPTTPAACFPHPFSLSVSSSLSQDTTCPEDHISWTWSTLEAARFQELRHQANVHMDDFGAVVDIHSCGAIHRSGPSRTICTSHVPLPTTPAACSRHPFTAP